MQRPRSATKTNSRKEWYTGYMERQREQHEAARQIGSELYTAAFEACALPDAEKALLPIRQMGGYLDENGILQLPGAFSDGMTSASQSGQDLYTFDPELAPDGRFLEVYADTVVRGYPLGSRDCGRHADGPPVPHVPGQTESALGPCALSG